jgi:integrase
MVVARLKHEKRVRGRNGKVYFYHQVTGERLPDDRNARLERLWEINKTLPAHAKPEPKGFPPGSIGRVIQNYKQSAAFKQLGKKTQREYTAHLDALELRWGKLSVAGLQRKHIMDMKDGMQDRPRQANYRLSVLSIIMGRAIDEEWRTDNPVQGIKRLPTGPGYQDWPDAVFAEAVQAAPKEVADYLRLLAYTGQRPGDVIAMTWQQVDRQAGYIEVVQSKTRQTVWVPLHPDLTSVLDGIEKRSPHILTRQSGRPWRDVNELARRVREVMQGLGYGHAGYTPHGLRHSAARAFAEVGCNDHEIMAITGHESIAMVQKYTKAVSRKRMAQAAKVKRFGDKQ